MTKREMLLEQLEETVFALMMDEVARKEGTEALEENKRLQDDERFAVPEATYRKGIATIKRHFCTKNRQTVMRVTSKVISRVAVIVLVMLLLFTTAFATIPEFRSGTLNLIMEVFDDRTRIEFGESAPEARMGETESLVGWVPEGFELVEKENNGSIYWEKYINAEDATLGIWAVKTEKMIHSFDTEHATVEEIDIGGYSGTMVSKGSRTQIVYFDSTQKIIYNITGEKVSCEDVIRVAENVRRVEK